MIAIIYLFGWFLSTASLVLMATAAISLSVDTPYVSSALFVSAVLIGFFGGALTLALHGRDKRIARAHAYAAAVIVWFAGPFFLCLPLRFGHEGTGWFEAYADMVSCFTTMGSVFLHDFNTLPEGLKLWRAGVAWLGGLASLAFIVVVLAPTKVGGLLIGKRHEPEHRSTTQWDRIIAMLTRVAPVYLGVTLVLFIAFELTGVPAIDALVLAMGTISTSGITTEAGDLSRYPGSGVAWVAIAGMAVGGFGFIWLGAIMRIKVSSIAGQWESFAALALSGLVAMPVAAALWYGGAGAAGLTVVDALGEGLMIGVSLVTTSGYSVRPESFNLIPLSLLLFIIAIGGVTVSTAGGFKVFRFLAMLSQSAREMNRLIYPHRVMAMRVGDQDYDIQLMKAIWAAFAVYCASVAIMAVILAVDMPDYISALAGAVAGLSTAGPVFEAIMAGRPDWQGFAALGAGPKLALVVAMTLGRLEILAILSLINIRLVRG